MKKTLLIFILLSICLFGCKKNRENKIIDENIRKEDSLNYKYLLNNGKYLYVSKDIIYNGLKIQDAINSENITIDEFIGNLELKNLLDDGYSKIYYYDENKDMFGKDSFYVIICNNSYNKNEIYISDDKEEIINNCSYKVNKVDGVTIKMKEDTITEDGATVIITDTNDKKNTYGQYYKIEKKVKGIYEEVTPIIKEYNWLTKAYEVDENNNLNFTVNWRGLYGHLPKGDYRLLKEVNNSKLTEKNYIAVEFTIN